MAQATFSVRMDEGLKKQFDELCSDFGMNASTAINVFARAVVRERRIPFEIAASEPEITREKAMQVFKSLRTQANKDFPNSMSLDEINSEINNARNGEDEINSEAQSESQINSEVQSESQTNSEEQSGRQTASEEQLEIQIGEQPISPWDYQSLLGKGMDVDWSKTRQGKMYYNAKAAEDFAAAGVSHVRIRIAD